MAKDKKRVLIWVDWMEQFEILTDDEAGKLIKHLFRYVNDLDPVAPDRLTEIAFQPMKTALKRDLKVYEDVCQKRSNAGKLSAEKRAKDKLQKQQNPTNPTLVDFDEKNPTNPTQKQKQKQKHIEVKEKSKRKPIGERKLDFSKSLSPFLEKYGKDLLNEFFRYWTETTPGGQKMAFELKKTWSVAYRLRTWSAKEWNQKPGNPEKTIVASVGKRNTTTPEETAEVAEMYKKAKEANLIKQREKAEDKQKRGNNEQTP